LRLNITGN